MWYEIFKFEIQYRAKRFDTYLFFIFLFLFSLVAVDFVFGDTNLGQVKKNAPLIIAKTIAIVSGIFMLITSMVMGVPVLRDFEHQMESLMFVNPIKKRDYLLGRFLGSFVALVFVFSGSILGIIFGEYMPWRNPEDSLPFNLWVYLQPFLYIMLPILFLGASVFFVTGALSRKLIVVYTQGIVFFVVFILTRNIENQFIASILDPFSFNTIGVMTEFWNVPERNSQLVPMNGVLLYGKLFWFVISVLVLIFGYYRFNFNVVKSKSHKKKNLIQNESNDTSKFNGGIPKFSLPQNFKSQCIQLIEHSLFYFKSILKEMSFWAIVICGVIIILINSVSLGTLYGVDSYPATYFIVEELQEMSIYFFIIILIFYSGELIWKERGAKLNLIYDAVPISNFINLAGKFIGLLLTYVVLMLFLILSGIIFQTAIGYYNYELQVYFYGFFVEIFPSLVLFTFISFFFQVIINRKFVGYIAVIAFFIVSIALNILGFNHDLYSFGGSSLGVYSDMNGYGHFLLPYLWIKTYWFLFCAILFIIAVIFSIRGTETNFKKRWKLSKQNLTKPLMRFGLIAIVAFIATGSYIFYNTNILNTYWTTSSSEDFRADYEKTLKKFEYLPQPRVTGVNLKVELYPKKRNYTVEGYYMLVNTHSKPLSHIHVQKWIDSQIDIEYVTFEGGTTANNQYKEYDHSIYILNQALQPGDSVKMKFKQTFTTKGFVGNGSSTRIIDNGTFFNNDNFPTLGYNRKYELRDNNDRKGYGLAPRKSMAKQNDIQELKKARNADDGYEINFEIVIGTSSDQIAIAPGSLQKEWTEGKRNYFHYKMENPMANFYSMVSAKYETKKDVWIPKDSISKPVALEIYYHKGHEYNLDRMMESMKMSFDYFSTNFSPYQYEEMRIMEFPRYAGFAQSFPSAVPFSESIGFMLDIDDEKDVDMAFFVTAHELAHQWWGLQVVSANVEGRYMILETLAQYSALMVLKQKYSEEKIQQFLQQEKEAYFRGRVSDKNPETSLKLADKRYVYYRKGAVNLYAFQDYIGEDNVNLALKRFIKDWNPFESDNPKDRYATTEDLLGYFKEVTPDSLQYIIKDLFETITLYDNKIVNVQSTKLDNGKYQVDIEFNVSKYRVDKKGNKIFSDNQKDSISYKTATLKSPVLSVPLKDYIEIGIFLETEKNKKTALYLKKHKVTQINNKITIIVDELPTEVGIDPYHKLIDPKSGDNRKKL